MEIIEALQRLDPNNDDHWTASGEPAVAAVSDLLGKSVTRAEISTAAPDFARPELRDPRDLAGGDAEGSGEQTGPETSGAPAADPREEGPIDGEDLAEDVRGIAELSGAPAYDRSQGPQDAETRVQWLEGMMARLAGGIAQAQAALKDMGEEHAKLKVVEPELSPDKRFAQDRAHYQQTQAILRANRAERLALLRESNIDIRQLAAVVHPSQLDAAMARKNQRGGRRPQRFEGSSSSKEPGQGS